VAESKILLVHMYGFTFPEGTKCPCLTIETGLIYHWLKEYWREYDQIVLLGGWICDRKRGWFMPDRPTSAEVVKTLLLDDCSLAAARFFTQFDLDCGHIQPARDTMEEADLGLHILQALTGQDPRSVPFEALCLRFHKPRVELIWKSRKASCQEVRGVPLPSWKLWFQLLPRILQEPVGLWITAKDPLGQGQFFSNLRGNRTHNCAQHYHKVVSPDDWR